MALPDGFGTLRVYRDVAYLVGEWHAADTQTYAWQGAGRYEIPDFLGHLEITQLATGGETALAPAVDFASGFTVKARQGGERLSPGPGRPRQSIKKLWQQTGTPPWMRDRLPFVWVQDVVIWAAGCEVCVPGWEIRWLPYPVHAAASGDSV